MCCFIWFNPLEDKGKDKKNNPAKLYVFKMKKNTFVLIGVALTLFLIFVLINIFRSLPKERKLGIRKELVEKLVIKRNVGEIMLEKKDVWYVNEYKADGDVVNEFLTNIVNLSVGDLISESESDITEFWVDDANGIFVKAFQRGKKTKEFIIGKTAHNFDTCYFRFPEEKKIYLCYNIQRFIFERGVDDWRDKTILNLNRAMIEEIKIVSKDKVVLTQREEGKWFISKPLPEKEIEASKIENFLNALLVLRADGFIRESKNIDFSKPDLKIEVKLKTGEEKISLKSFAGDYAVLREGDEYIYRVYKYKFDNLNFKP